VGGDGKNAEGEISIFFSNSSFFGFVFVVH
jgi:hypothetical protein